MTDLIPYLKERRLKVTPQRMSILKILNRCTHPSVDELYEEIQKDFPSISLATVYKNLNILKETGMVFEISTNAGKPRLDINIYPHAHIICKHCGSVEDAEFMKSAYLYQKELEKKSMRKITKLDITATVDSCGRCQNL
ncbi:MAG: transcriptional repressor [Campylobacteraceae bacterium]|nr:transcriptional repressor [Campylobacteraceae bacterium]